MGEGTPRRTYPIGSIGTVLLAGSLLCCSPWQDAAPPLVDRAAFARKMARVKEGMTRAEVIEILGQPDDVVTGADKMIYTSNTKQILGYGNGRNMKQFVRNGKVELRLTDGRHLGFPTLGSVYLDGDDRVQYAFGGKPFPGLSLDLDLEEAKLRDLLELLDEASPYRIGQYTPRTIIAVTNALHPLGKDGALDVVEEYLRVASGFSSDAEQGLFLVLRVLFEVPSGSHHPPMLVGAPTPAEPDDPRLFPRFPIALADDVPYLLIHGYRLGGEAEPLRDHVDHFRKHGVLRANPLRPAARGRAALEELLARVKRDLPGSEKIRHDLESQYRATTGQ